MRGLWLLIAGICLTQSLTGQVFVSPKKMAPGLALALEVNDAKDLEFIRNNLRKFYGVQKVRVNGQVDISQVAATLSLLDDLDEVQLIRFAGQLNDEDLEKLAWVNNITLMLRNGKEDQILLNDGLGKFAGITLIFEVAPENYDFMKGWKVRSLSIVAPFVKKEVAQAVAAAAGIPTLREFGISLDQVTDLPASVRNIRNLERLILIDNLSWLSEKYLDNLSVLHKNIEYPAGAGVRYLDFKYKATDAELMPWEQAHMAALFPGGRLAPLMNQYGDTTLSASFTEFIPLQKTRSNPWVSYKRDKDLIPGLTEGNYEFTGDNSRNMVFYLGADAAVLIPAGCMASADDSAWRGTYNLRLAVLNSPGRQFSAAYNLGFDSAGRRYSLAAGSIVEINAVGDVLPLKVRDGYFIKVMFMAPADTVSRFYAWNNARQKWENGYDYDYYFDDSRTVPIDFYSFYSVKKKATEVYPAERSSLDLRFDREGYFYLLEPGKNKISLEPSGGFFIAPVYDRAPKAGAYTLRRGRGLIGLRKEYTDKKSEQDIIRFTVYDKTQTLFPELKTFENYPLEVESSMNPRDFSAQFIRGAVYSDVRFEQQGSAWFMDLKTETGIWRFTLLQPAVKWRKNASRAKTQQAEFIRRMQQYMAARAKKEAAMQLYLSQYSESGIQNARRTLMYGQIKPRGLVAREFRVRSTGLFAWAYPTQVPDTGQVHIRFTDAGGIPLDIRQAWIAHDKPYSYSSFGASETYKFAVVPRQLSWIACRDFSGKVYYITGEQYRAKGIRSNSLIFLPVAEIPRNMASVSELEKLLGLNLRR